MNVSSIQNLKKWIRESTKIIVFTGAGISTESGISDYRSQGGLWQRYQPVTIQEFLNDENKRREFWRRKKETYVQMREAKPNIGHHAIAALENEGKLMGLITQNIDGLHQMAGNNKVLEIHGTNREVICLDCGDKLPFEVIYERMLAGEEVPVCQKCDGLLKSNTISFGQPLNMEVLNDAVAWCRRTDLMLAIGSTLIVEPAASLPKIAKNAGAKLIIVNRDPTPLDNLADLVFHSNIGDFFRQLQA